MTHMVLLRLVQDGEDTAKVYDWRHVGNEWKRIPALETLPLLMLS